MEPKDNCYVLNANKGHSVLLRVGTLIMVFCANGTLICVTRYAFGECGSYVSLRPQLDAGEARRRKFLLISRLFLVCFTVFI